MKLQLIILCCVLQSIYGQYRKSNDLNFRIVGGENAPEKIAPYTCSLQLNGSHNCGGVIISKRWILTAAHCVHGKKASTLGVLVGTNCVDKGGKRYEVEEYIAHEKYKHVPNTFDSHGSDIALIRVKGEIEFNDRVQSIPLSSEEFSDGVEALLTGWGRVENMEQTKCMKMLKMKVYTTERCKKTSLGPLMDQTHICTLNKKGSGACHGDSGGPLVLNNKLIGVANFVKPCGLGYPDVFSKVSHFLDWIKKNTK